MRLLLYICRCYAQRVVPVRCLRPGYRHLPLRDGANHPLDQSMLFLFSKFEQEEIIYLFDDNQDFPSNYEQQLTWQTLKADPVKIRIYCARLLLFHSFAKKNNHRKPLLSSITVAAIKKRRIWQCQKFSSLQICCFNKFFLGRKSGNDSSIEKTNFYIKNYWILSR